MEKKVEKKEMEICVSCGKETIIPKSLNIDFRKNYIEGAGQLCDECSNKIYGKWEQERK